MTQTVRLSASPPLESSEPPLQAAASRTTAVAAAILGNLMCTYSPFAPRAGDSTPVLKPGWDDGTITHRLDVSVGVVLG
ncbi:hypothetical protein GCM10009602_22470 [Nocardiopsis tropica]